MILKSHKPFAIVGGVGGEGGEPPIPPTSFHISDSTFNAFISSLRSENPLQIVTIILTDKEMAIQSLPKNQFAELGAIIWANQYLQAEDES